MKVRYPGREIYAGKGGGSGATTGIGNGRCASAENITTLYERQKKEERGKGRGTGREAGATTNSESVDMGFFLKRENTVRSCQGCD